LEDGGLDLLGGLGPFDERRRICYRLALMKKAHKPIYYGDYLGLDRILDAQHPESTKAGHPAHDEMLFIIVHQAYELWFKQILHELDAVAEDFGGKSVDEKRVGTAASRLRRVVEIQKILIDQIRVLETMTPQDFLEFRDYLTPASGFQSLQFRLLELKLGLQTDKRVAFDKSPFYSRLSEKDRARVLDASKAPSLFDLVERWLERTPFLEFGKFDFWQSYGQAVDVMLGNDESIINDNATLTAEQKERELAMLKGTRESFAAILHAEGYESLREKGTFRLSHAAMRSALLINLYREQPILTLPFQLLGLLAEIDENFSIWRYRHAMMVHRMIGTKIGTGGSSGHHYLKKTAETHRVFADLFSISTFLLPRSSLPQLPPDLEKALGFHHAG
jgi:tryptophan 2,3-dioxygenase